MQYPRIDDPAHRRTPAKAGAGSGFRTSAKAGLQSGAVRRSRLWIPAFAGIRVSVTAGLIAALAACNPGSENNTSAPAPDNATLTNDTAPATGNLDAAVQAAFGDNATYDGKNEHYVLDHHRLVQAPFGPVLVSEGTAQDAAHASAGLISAIYLKPEGSSYSVVKRYPEAIETGSFGEVGSWKIRDDLLDLPVIEAIGGGTWQGYSCQYTDDRHNDQEFYEGEAFIHLIKIYKFDFWTIRSIIISINFYQLLNTVPTNKMTTSITSRISCGTLCVTSRSFGKCKFNISCTVLWFINICKCIF